MHFGEGQPSVRWKSAESGLGVKIRFADRIVRDFTPRVMAT